MFLTSVNKDTRDEYSEALISSPTIKNMLEEMMTV